MSKGQAPTSTPTPVKGEVKSKDEAANQRSVFLGAALDMSWQLAIVVLVPVIGGVKLDQHFKTSPVLMIVGLALALIGSAAVMWRTVQAANRLPVPKLTPAQKRKIQKEYEEEDEDR